MERPYRQILLAFVVAALSPLFAETYVIAPAADAELRLKVYKTGIMSGKAHDCVFARYSGEIDFDAESPENSTVKIEIEADSLICEDDWVSAKDLAKIEREVNANVLKVEQHPVIAFRSSGMRLIGPRTQP